MLTHTPAHVCQGFSYPETHPIKSGGSTARTLTILFRRDPSKDRSRDKIDYEGYTPCWPDGRPVTVGLDAFCRHGQRLLGLGRHLKGRPERLIRMTCFPLQSEGDNLVRLPGHRVRRFFIARTGKIGRIHFFDGTPTTTVFVLGRDEPRVLSWIGLAGLADGDRQWFDLAALPVESPAPHSRTYPDQLYISS